MWVLAWTYRTVLPIRNYSSRNCSVKYIAVRDIKLQRSPFPLTKFSILPLHIVRRTLLLYNAHLVIVTLFYCILIFWILFSFILLVKLVRLSLVFTSIKGNLTWLDLIWLLRDNKGKVIKIERVRTLRMKMREEWESRDSRLTQIYLENDGN